MKRTKAIVKPAKTGVTIKMTRTQFDFFCISVQNCVSVHYMRRYEISSTSVNHRLYGIILTNFLRSISEKMKFPETKENNVKLTYTQALVIWDLSFNYGIIPFPGHSDIMIQLHKHLIKVL